MENIIENIDKAMELKEQLLYLVAEIRHGIKKEASERCGLYNALPLSEQETQRGVNLQEDVSTLDDLADQMEDIEIAFEESFFDDIREQLKDMNR